MMNYGDGPVWNVLAHGSRWLLDEEEGYRVLGIWQEGRLDKFSFTDLHGSAVWVALPHITAVWRETMETNAHSKQFNEDRDNFFKPEAMRIDEEYRVAAQKAQIELQKAIMKQVEDATEEEGWKE